MALDAHKKENCAPDLIEVGVPAFCSDGTSTGVASAANRDCTWPGKNHKSIYIYIYIPVCCLMKEDVRATL